MAASNQLIRKLLPYTSAALVIALLYLIWVFASRWNHQRGIARDQAEREAESARQITEQYGAGEMKILAFYASPPVVARGQKGLLCYGVANARSVGIEPGVEPLKPSMSRCIEVAPKQTTEYVLTAEDAAGKTMTQTAVVQVK